MRNDYLRLAAAVVALTCVVPTLEAQRIGDRLQEATDIQVCRSGSTASRVKQDCDFQRTETIGLELERTTTIEISIDDTPFCTAEIALEYYQRNTIARVEGTIDVEECDAASGSYSVGARIRNAAGEIETLEFEEQWQRDDDQPIAVGAEYEIGANVELLRLGARRSRCRCADETPPEAD